MGLELVTLTALSLTACGAHNANHEDSSSAKVKSASVKKAKTAAESQAKAAAKRQAKAAAESKAKALSVSQAQAVSAAQAAQSAAAARSAAASAAAESRAIASSQQQQTQQTTTTPNKTQGEINRERGYDPKGQAVMPGQDHAPGSNTDGTADPWVQGQVDQAKQNGYLDSNGNETQKGQQADQNVGY